MTNTVSHIELANWWDGKVIIDEVKEYVDDRGCLSELWRIDDDKTNVHDEISGTDSTPVMSYWSETKPFVQRGPHQHIEQTDNFISWKNSMIYHLYNQETNEMKYFITDPSKIYRVKVAPPIIHSYRNVGFKDMLTGNFPTSLFYGKDKKGWRPDQKCDEIRHEELVEPTKTYWVLGSGGRLGNSFIKKLYETVGYHTINVIPIFEKFSHTKEGYENLNKLLNVIKNTPNSVIINCVSNTNTRESDSLSHHGPNHAFPTYLVSFAAKEKVKLITFSTDYVYQLGQHNQYTTSKINFEQQLTSMISISETEWTDQEKQPTEKLEDHDFNFVKVFRVANLFSVDKKEDMFDRIYKAIKDGSLRVPTKDWSTLPTSTDVLAKWVIDNEEKCTETFTNVCGKQYTMENVVKDLFQSEVPLVETGRSLVDLNHSAFIADNCHIIDCDTEIKEKISKIKNG
jgi:dTDP-4-dehydrorhamnose 3,5-epimerase